jgi:hypothetical protein
MDRLAIAGALHEIGLLLELAGRQSHLLDMEPR